MRQGTTPLQFHGVPLLFLRLLSLYSRLLPLYLLRLCQPLTDRGLSLLCHHYLRGLHLMGHVLETEGIHIEDGHVARLPLHDQVTHRQGVTLKVLGVVQVEAVIDAVQRIAGIHPVPVLQTSPHFWRKARRIIVDQFNKKCIINYT